MKLPSLEVVSKLDMLISFAKQIFCGVVDSHLLRPVKTSKEFLSQWISCRECHHNEKDATSSSQKWNLNSKLLSFKETPKEEEDSSSFEMEHLSNQTSFYRSIIMLILCNYLLSEIEMFCFVINHWSNAIVLGFLFKVRKLFYAINKVQPKFFWLINLLLSSSFFLLFKQFNRL